MRLVSLGWRGRIKKIASYYLNGMKNLLGRTRKYDQIATKQCKSTFGHITIGRERFLIKRGMLRSELSKKCLKEGSWSSSLNTGNTRIL